MTTYLLRQPARRAYPVLILLLVTHGAAYSQTSTPEAPQKRLAGLSTRYREGKLSDTFYLKGVDSIARDLLNDDSLVEELSTYRQAAFGNKDLGKYRMLYYRYLAVWAINKNNFGSAVYYSEKNNEEAIKIGVFEKEGVPHSDLFTVSVYQNNQDYPRLIAKYNALLPQLEALPALTAAGKMSGEQGYVVLSIMGVAVWAFYKTHDTAHAGQGIRLFERVLMEVNKQPEKYKKYLTRYDYDHHVILYERARYRGQMDSAQVFLEQAIGDARSPGYLKNLQISAFVDIYSEAFDFFYERGRLDSARYYLDEVSKITDAQIGFSGIKQGIVLEGESKLLAAKGDYPAAYRMLDKLYRMRDSALHAVNADKDNNLYALAEAENARRELLQTEAKQRRAEKFNFFLVLFFSLLVVGGVAGFMIYRSGQRQRMLNLRLGLARNFHDEIGPMLLYAHTLVKKELEEEPSPRLEELKNQVGYVMEAVRGISHDLKSNELSTLEGLYKDVAGSLGKIKGSTGVDFTIKMNDGGRVLGHLQYMNLKKIIDEMISNSIKHAQCRTITLNMKATGRKLLIVYSDDGKGMAPERLSGGIGIQNMQERANLLNGDFQLHNAYPEGYFIDVTIPLL
ncbi:MAG TPA: ATP-binding protein [Puia sp.]|nr:ATP-binding protein [Puia sp.]